MKYLGARLYKLGSEDAIPTDSRKNGLDYRSAGVDIDAGEELVEAIKPLARGTMRPGADAALGGFGGFFDPAAAGYLQELVESNGADATEAALALGRLGDRRAIPLLVTTVQNHTLAVGTRTAAACALLDLNEPTPAVPLLRAVLLAATPYEREPEQQGLPRKGPPRWAYERYMAIEAIRRFSGGKTFGLDEDAPWPRLRDGVAAFERFMQERRRP